MTDRQTYFETEALPLRGELEKAAFRYTGNFHDAEDLVAETYAKAWAGFANFRMGSNIRAWLHRILTNTWIDMHRRAEVRPRESLTDEFTDAQLCAADKRYDAAPSAEEHNLREMPSDELVTALQTLSESQRAVIFYADIRQLPYKVIADITGLPLGTVMSSVHRARYRLRASLNEASELTQRRSA